MSITDLAYIDATGYHYSDYPSFLEWLQGEYRTIYGADVYLGSDSQDGQFLAVLAQAFFDTAALGAATYNAFSPLTAQGVGLSRDVLINGIERRSPTYSTADLTLVGTVGTVIDGGVAQDTLDQKWDIPYTVIPIAGTIVATAVAQEVGAIQALPSTINKIFTPTRGWQTVNNIAAATAGEPVETDAELRARQAVSTANPSLTVFDGTIGAVANVIGVTNVRGYENDTASTDANTLPAHSISIVVEGGDATDIAEVIALHKTPGTQTYGTTTENVTDSHGMPLAIHFYRPTQKTITVEVTIDTDTGYTSDYAQLIKDAVAAYIVGLGIGASIIINKLIVPASLPGTVAGTTYTITLIQIAISPAAVGSSAINLAFNQIPLCDPDVNVVVTT